MNGYAVAFIPIGDDFKISFFAEPDRKKQVLAFEVVYEMDY